MTARRAFIAELLDGGKTLAMTEKYAMNSGIRASEALVREHARKHGGPFTGEPPTRYGEEYRRVWVGPDGQRVTARVVEVHS